MGNQRGLVMKPRKHQRSSQGWQDLCWKVHDRAQYFVLRSYTMHDYVTNTFLLVSSSVRSKQLLQSNQVKRTPQDCINELMI